MKKKRVHLLYLMLAVTLTVVFPLNSSAQIKSEHTLKDSKTGLGFRVGINLASVSGSTDSVNYDYSPGLMVAVFLSPHSHGIVGYRSELLYSRQGFKYSDPKGNNGTVSNDYIMLPQMMTLNLTKFVQIQAGAFAGYLLHTKNSNSAAPSPDNNTYLDLMNRLDYGAAAGIEVHPFKGLILNGRYNIGFSKLYKEEPSYTMNNLPGSIMPFGNIDTKDAVIQLSLGYQF